MHIRPTPIAAAAALALLGPVQAQTAARPDDAPQVIEVTGIRGSLEKSLAAKRNADTHVEVITAEDIGKMPDKNVADSLQRVPGVTISSASATEGGFDENDRVSMRGTNASLTQTLINGHAVSSGDWFVLNQTQSVGRSVSYSLLPSELVQSVIVHKSSEASLVEGGVAGSVNIVTRKPLQFGKPLTVEASVGAVYADLPGKTDGQFSGLVNWKNDAGTVGVLVQAFAENRHLRRDGQELLGYEQIAAGSAVALAHPDLAGVYYPKMIGSALFEQKRERRGGLLDVQVKPVTGLSFDFTAFMSDMKAANYNRNYMLWATHFINGGAGQSPDAGYVVRNNTLVSATFSPVAGTQYGVYDQISRPDAKSDSAFYTLDADWAVNDRLRVSGQIGTTRGTGETPTQDVAEWNTGIGSGASWRLHGIGAADWSLGTANNASPAGVPLGWIFGDQNVKVKDKEDFAHVDGSWGIDSGALTTLRFGLRATSHDRDSWNIVGQGPGCKTAAGATVPFDWSQADWCPVGTTSPANPANFPQGYANYPGNFGSGLGGSFPSNIWFYSPDQLAAYNRLTNRATNGSREDWPSEFGLKEKTQAAYTQLDFDGGAWGGNVGLRVVRSKQSVTNNVGAFASTPGAVTVSDFGPYVRQVTDHTYTDWLPSLNVKYKLDASKIVRFAASKTMTRPDYSALAGTVSLSPPATAGGTGSGSGGNPDLKPVRSTNVDASFEWYYATRSLLSASVYRMDLTSYVGYGQVTRSYMTYSSTNPAGFLANYVLTVPVNTGGKAQGIELTWEQPIAQLFGVATNYTYTDAHEDGGGPLVGASRHTANVVGYFENDRFNVRVAVNYRSSFYSGLDRSTAFYQDASSNVGASFGWKISDNLALSLDGRNLNNPKLKYYALNEDQPRSIYQNGRQYFLTLRAKL